MFYISLLFRNVLLRAVRPYATNTFFFFREDVSESRTHRQLLHTDRQNDFQITMKFLIMIFRDFTRIRKPLLNQ